MLVIDSSVILASVLPDEESHYADEVLKRLEAGSIIGCVPALFHLEIANVLHFAERRRRITSEQTKQGIEAIGFLPLSVDTEAAFPITIPSIHSAMQTHNLTAYDASYLELALRRHFPLATLDSALRTACQQVGVLFSL